MSGVLVAAALLRAGPAQAAAPITARPPNIIFIMADDLGYGDVGVYGQKRIPTPNLDRLAQEGMRFTQFYAGAPVCAPSRNVLMTGEHTGHAQIRGNAKFSLRPSDVTVGQVLKKAGYFTGLIGKWGLGSEGSDGTPNKKGFDYFFGYVDQTHAHNSYPTFLVRNESHVLLRNIVPNEGRYGQGVATQRIDYSPDLMTEDALVFLEKHRSAPFFLYLASTLPHANDEAGAKGMEVPDLGAFANENWPEPEKRYAAIVARLDRDVGRIAEKLKALNLDENTVVFFTSDNGPHREGGHDPDFFHSSGPFRGIKRDVYEGGIRVPLIVRWPGHISPGTVSDHIAYFGDFISTAAELSGVVAPPNLDSVSFLPTLLGKTNLQKSHDHLYWEFYEGESSQAVRLGNWKGVRIPMLSGPIELFDLATDVAEQRNVAADHPEITKQISAIMAQEHVPSPLWHVPNRATKLIRDDKLSGWEFVNPQKTPLSSGVTVQPGGIVSAAGKPIGYLQTTATYSNYQLHAEWRWTDKPGNGGVLVHISTGPVDRNTWPVCFQIQLKHTRAGDILPMAKAKFSEPLSSAADAKTPVLNFSGTDSERPVGEWNSCDIVCHGDTVRVMINGTLQNRITKCTPAAGHVGFQFEGTPFEFRDVWIRSL